MLKKRLSGFAALLPPEHSGDSGGNAEHNHRDLDELYRQECEHAALGLEFPRGDAQEHEIYDELWQDAEHAPLPREIEEQSAPRAYEHPDVVRVNKREQENVGLAFVIRSVTAPAGALVE